MVTINLNFNNFSGLPTLLEVFGSFDNNYEYTADGIFRRKVPPFCPRCSSPMVHNGYNIYTKKGLGAVSYTHLRAHETGRNLVCRLLLEKKKKKKKIKKKKKKKNNKKKKRIIYKKNKQHK